MTITVSEESVCAALKDFDKLLKTFETSQKKKELESKVRARSREVLTNVWTGGLCPTLTFYLAKAEEENIAIVKETVEERKSLDGEPEKLGYAIILYLTFRRLKVLKFIEQDLSKPRECLQALITMEPFRRTYATNLLTSYLLEFKKLCEAVFKE
ncbi:MAG: type III-B CRISPR module-associated protein Cmr5 [Thermoproteota archaeon]